MKKIDILLKEYGESHQNKKNKFIHWICVPLIFFSIVGLIWSIPFPFANYWDGFLNWATIGLFFVLIYYFSLSASLFISMTLFVVILVVLVKYIDTNIGSLWLISMPIFIVAWFGQFYGHRIEGKKPSFFKDIQFLLIGPAWLMSFIYKKMEIPL